MVVQLRDNQRVRETFGKYIDPRVVEGLIDRAALTAAEGQRRVMTVLFCDLRGFTSLSEGMTPQGVVKVMNRYLSIMSEPIAPTGGSSTNISATASWRIGDLLSLTRPIMPALPVSLPRR
jgi:adenylate cyclase